MGLRSRGPSLLCQEVWTAVERGLMRPLHDRVLFVLGALLLVLFSAWSVHAVREARQFGIQQGENARTLQQLQHSENVLQTHDPDDPIVLRALDRLTVTAQENEDPDLEAAAALLRDNLDVPGGRDDARVQVVQRIGTLSSTLWSENHRLEVRLEDRWASVQLVAVASTAFGASVLGLLVLVRRRDRALEEALASAEASSRAKSDFLATVSHEIRTPMTAILGTSELLGLGELTPDQREHVSVVRQGSEALLRLVDEVLDISRIEAGHLELEDEAVEVEELLDALMLLFAEPARSKGLMIACLTDPTVPRVVYCDGSRLRQILVNLLGNAIKFTDSGQVVIRVRHARGHLQVRVDDTGFGIQPEAQRRIFKAFEQAGERRTVERRGTGLGLAITQHLVLAMGGQVNVSSTPGEGSTFFFHVRAPLMHEAPPPDVREVALRGPDPTGLITEQLTLWGVAVKEGAEASIDPGALLPLRPGRLRRALKGEVTSDLPEVTAELPTEPWIAVVDDQPDNREVIGSLLQALGCRVQLFESGEAALAAEGGWDVVLMDLDMPGLDGLATTRAFRGRGLDIPILGLSGHATESAKSRGLTAGMNDYLTKPVRLNTLREALERWG